MTRLYHHLNQWVVDRVTRLGFYNLLQPTSSPSYLVYNQILSGYDGGDCCECTCESGTLFACGDGGYACINPRAPCVDDDDYTPVDSDDESLGYTTTFFCETGYISDGDCDAINNKADCGTLVSATMVFICGSPSDVGFVEGLVIPMACW